MHTHNEISHFGIANTMAALRENWWIPRLRSKVKRIINECNVCKAYRVKPYGRTATAELPTFRIESGRPFETTGVDFAGPLTSKLTKKEEVLHPNIYVCYIQSRASRVDEDTICRGIQSKTKRLHRKKEQTKVDCCWTTEERLKRQRYGSEKVNDCKIIWQDKTEYVHSLMEHHRVIKGENARPEVGEMMLVVGEEKNRAEWKRGKVVELIKGKDNVVRGVKILMKGQTIERPLSLVCFLELKETEIEESKLKETKPKETNEIGQRKSKKQAAKDARCKILQLIQEEEY